MKPFSHSISFAGMTSAHLKCEAGPFNRQFISQTTDETETAGEGCANPKPPSLCTCRETIANEGLKMLSALGKTTRTLPKDASHLWDS